MTAPSPTTHDCIELLRGNSQALLHLLAPEQLDRLTEEQINQVLHILKVTAETSLRLSEVAHVDALTRNELVKDGKGGETYGEEAVISAETVRIRSEVEKVAAETERVKMETERVKAETERVNAETLRRGAEQQSSLVELERVKAMTAYNESRIRSGQ